MAEIELYTGTNLERFKAYAAIVDGGGVFFNWYKVIEALQTKADLAFYFYDKLKYAAAWAMLSAKNIKQVAVIISTLQGDNDYLKATLSDGANIYLPYHSPIFVSKAFVSSEDLKLYPKLEYEFKKGVDSLKIVSEIFTEKDPLELLVRGEGVILT